MPQERRGKLPSREELQRFKDEHPSWSNVRIGAHFGTSGEAVRRKLGNSVPRSGPLLPWVVRQTHCNGNHLYRAILAYAKWRAGEELSDAEQVMRQRVEQRAVRSNAVLSYDPDEGFYWRSRRPDDDASVLAP